MAWSTLLCILGTIVAGTVGQVKYGPYKGPPVVPVILPGGFIADTKEVAAAKEYHLNALAKTAAEVKDNGPKNYYNTGAYQQPQYQPQYQPQQIYKPAAPRYQQPQVAYQPAPTPVFQPQPQRYTAPQEPRPAPVYEQRQNYDDGRYEEEQQYQYVSTSKRPDPLVTPRILDNGYIADTQEVDAAKQQHFALVAKAQELVARAQERAAKEKAGGYSGGYQAVAPAAPAPPQQQYFEY